ncbi:gliding motility-associated C-terminal domain-containing protein [Mucilaginibacter sp. BJC16-A38]|uniref:gliding motility-associated C-terminal domain-containing protein n=1 Tax=Mucilaginibacter phenanthrenivorans TaxID=1234842 RepID=UPI002158848E|nr:gliding motility-associated C-terminal domain-containing protein [Mucilaginibacter phenanthrenivorans]MCR8559354.1 gliding motility-associated C-terminal domain-containing protein [Mucilaginibacter phenanthrenivorans]
MRTSWIKLFLLAACLCFFKQSHGQTQECTGSLGDPVFKEDFGSGTNPGPALGSAVTNYPYVGSDCPNDGNYTIINRTSGCFSGWRTMTDHTGNPNGYFMLINASSQPGLFYTQAVPAGQLCPGTQYEFSAYINNVLLPGGCGGAGVKPNLTFTIQKPDGTPIGQPYNTNDVPSVEQGQDGWIKYSTYFTTPVDVTSVIVRIVNNKPGGDQCGNDLALDDITFRACGPIIQTGFSSVTGKTTQDVCLNDSQTVTLKAKADGSSIYQWQFFNTVGNSWTDIPGANSDTYVRLANNSVAGTYLYRVGIVAGGGDINTLTCRTYSAPLSVVVNALPVASITPLGPVCEGTPLILTASGGDTYVWSGTNIQNSSQNPLVISNATLADAGKYTVTPYRITPNSQLSCAGTPADVQVTITPKPVIKVDDVAPICIGETTQLNASGGLYYKWTPSTGLDHDDIPNPKANPSVTTTYNLTASNNACSDNTKSVTVTVMKLPTADAGSDKKIFEGQSVKLNGTVTGDNIASISWFPTTALDDPTSATPIANPTDDITYVMTVTSQSCGIATSLPVFVKVYKKIVIPNTFSPNNDGINDLWNIEALFTYAESNIQIFNRYGKRVFQSTGYSKPWDGTYNGSPLPEGTYYYIIDLKNNTPKLSGWVMLVK